MPLFENLKFSLKHITHENPKFFMQKLNQYMSIRTCMLYSYVNGLIFLHYTNHILVHLFCDRDMSNLNKLDFTALEVSGRNYLKWVQDVKLHLTAKNLRPAIEEATD